MSARGPNSISSMEYRRDRKHEPNRLGEASTVASTVCEQQMVCLPVPPHLFYEYFFNLSCNNASNTLLHADSTAVYDD